MGPKALFTKSKLKNSEKIHPAVYVASYVGRKSEVKKCRQKDLKMLRALLSIC